MPTFNKEPGKGIYNTEYYSGSTVGIYIGSVWVDEITSLTYEFNQNRVPLYGYADQLYRDLAHGQVLVTGSFSINFKEAGYLWLILNEYRKLIKGQETLMGEDPRIKPFVSSSYADRDNISQIINKETPAFERNQVLQQLVEAWGQEQFKDKIDNLEAKQATRNSIQANLGGFSSRKRLKDPNNQERTAEDMFEQFEDAVWQIEDDHKLNQQTRRADDPRLNPFDIYIAYGDFMGDNTVNHTIRKLVNVSIIGGAQQIVADGQPIQEIYRFVAQNVV
jgi:hypothetical protein